MNRGAEWASCIIPSTCFRKKQRAQTVFDWWHFALIEDSGSPFGNGQPGDLSTWLESRKQNILEVAAKNDGDAKALSSCMVHDK